MYKKLIALTLAAMFAFILSSTAFAAGEEIMIIINGEEIEFDQPPVIENGRTLIPFRAVLEAMGANVDWDANTKTITFSDSNNEITASLKLGENSISISRNGNKYNVPIDVPAKVINGRTLVPIRWIAENLGANVDWNADKKTVSITTAGSENKPSDEFMSAITELNNMLQKVADNVNSFDEDSVKECELIGREIIADDDFMKGISQYDDVIPKIKEYIQRLKVILEKNGLE